MIFSKICDEALAAARFELGIRRIRLELSIFELSGWILTSSQLIYSCLKSSRTLYPRTQQRTQREWELNPDHVLTILFAAKAVLITLSDTLLTGLLKYFWSDYFTGKNYFTEKKSNALYSSVYTLCGVYG